MVWNFAILYANIVDIKVARENFGKKTSATRDC